MIHVVDQLHRLPQSPTAALWTAYAGGAVAVVMLARLSMLAISPPQLPLVDAPPSPIATTRSARQPIASWHLFGLPMNESQVAATTLALTLRGTVDSSDPALGTAIIAGQDQKDAGYHVGDILPGGSVLEAIHADHVEIRNNGRRESLSLTDKPTAHQSGSAAAPAQSNATINAAAVVVGATGARSNAEVSAQTTAAAALGSQANVLPVVENGQVVGARISVADVALLERVGLRRDDVVLSIDGQPVANGGFDQALEERLRSGGVDLVVRRDGREQTVRVGR
jgi:general secretion pathway protein C